MTESNATRPYELFDGDDPSGALSIPPGNSVLVTAAGSGGQRFIESQLGRGVRNGERTLVVTADDPAGTVADAVAAAAGVDRSDLAERLRVIDCQTDGTGTNGEGIVTQDVETPRDLTDIGIGFKQAFDGFEADGSDRVRVGVLSLSVVLSYVDRETVYRFCQTLSRGIRQENAVGFFMLAASAHDEETENTLRRAFDGTVEVDEEDGCSVRVVGMDGVASEWRSVDD